MNPFPRFLQGIGFYFRGFGLLARYPKLFGLALIPILLTVVVLVGLAGGSAWLLGRWLDSSQMFTSDGQVLLQVLVFLAVLFLMYLLYLPLTRVFLAPFSERLSRKTSELTGETQLAKVELGIVRAMLEGLKLVVVQLVLVVVVLLLTVFVPPVGVPVGIFVTICFCGIDFLDVPLGMRGLSLREKLTFLWRNRARVAGFAVAGYLLLHIPVFNLLVLPVGVMGATLLVNQAGRESG